MLIFVALSVLSLALYVIYKVRLRRNLPPMERQWLGAKSRMALGFFIGFYGANVIFSLESTISLVVGIVFILIGLANVISSFKQYRFYLPLALEEVKKGRL